MDSLEAVPVQQAPIFQAEQAIFWSIPINEAEREPHDGFWKADLAMMTMGICQNTLRFDVVFGCAHRATETESYAFTIASR
jgi:hypothetical protein